MIVIKRYPFRLKGLLGARLRRREARFKNRRIHFARWWDLSLCSADEATTNSDTTISAPLARHHRTRRATVNGRKLLIEPAHWYRVEVDRSLEFQLYCDRIERILAAPGYLSFVSDSNTAFNEVQTLIGEWELFHADRMALSHATKLLQQSKRFVTALFDQRTDVVMQGTFPPRRLARFRQEFEQFVSAIEFQRGWFANLKQHDLKRRGHYDRKAVIRVPSFQDNYIKSNVVPAYEKIYGTPARRIGRDGTFSGPFINFATVFFREVGNPVAIRTISRALQRPPPKVSNPEQAVLGNPAKSVKLPN